MDPGLLKNLGKTNVSGLAPPKPGNVCFSKVFGRKKVDLGLYVGKKSLHGFGKMLKNHWVFEVFGCANRATEPPGLLAAPIYIFENHKDYVCMVKT